MLPTTADPSRSTESPSTEPAIDPKDATAPGDAGPDEPDVPVDPDAPGRGLDEVDDPIPEPNEPA